MEMNESLIEKLKNWPKYPLTEKEIDLIVSYVIALEFGPHQQKKKENVKIFIVVALIAQKAKTYFSGLPLSSLNNRS